MDRILMILTILMLSVSSVFAGVESAQYLQGGNIRVVMQDGRTLIVPDDMANRHRQLIAEWVGEGNAIIPADPSPVPTRQEKIRSDPDFPNRRSLWRRSSIAVLDRIAPPPRLCATGWCS